MHFKPAPPSSIAPSFRILVVKAKMPILFTSICEQYVGLDTHYWGGHTVACELPGHCEPCHRANRRDYKAYLAAQADSSGTRIIVQVTHSISLMLKPYVARSEGLLGLRIGLRRATDKDTSMLQISFHGYIDVQNQITRESLEKMLSRVLNANAGKADAAA